MVRMACAQRLRAGTDVAPSGADPRHVVRRCGARFSAVCFYAFSLPLALAMTFMLASLARLKRT